MSQVSALLDSVRRREIRRAVRTVTAGVPHGSLIAPRLDLWFAGAASVALLVGAFAVLHWHGDNELGWVDFVLAELHVGAMWSTIVQRRLWRAMPLSIVAVPVALVAITYASVWVTQEAWVVTSMLYLAIWHRGRQNYGVARAFQRMNGGPESRLHAWLFAAAIYVPMAGAALAYNAFHPDVYEDGAYFALSVPAELAWTSGALALLCVTAYAAWSARRGDVHPGERWTVLTHGAAFGAAYWLGAWNVAFVLVLTLHHDVQYLYFTYAAARRGRSGAGELGVAATWLLWPLLGLAFALYVKLWDVDWLMPLVVGGLIAHYWLDGRIWRSRAGAGAGRSPGLASQDAVCER